MFIILIISQGLIYANINLGYILYVWIHKLEVIVIITRDDLVMEYLIAEDKGALDAGILNVRETAGYWIYHVQIPNMVRSEFERLLKSNNIDINENKFYSEVSEILKEVKI